VHSTTNSMTRPLTLAAGLLAAVCLALIAAPGAPAESGGVGPGGGSGGAGADDANRNLTPSKYERLWDRVSQDDRRWANRVAQCETGRDPNLTALGGDYRGAFMFTWDAWKTSPKTPGGDPIDYSYRVQAVVAVALKGRDGTAPWPVCG
jgi:Transglycosylase-like domain